MLEKRIHQGHAAFSLIELIGVLAIMAIMAGVLAPNVLKSIESAAVRAEGETLRNLGEQAKLYLRDNAVKPTAANWNTVIARYASIGAADILTNRRQRNRIYLVDPTAANERAMIISGMRSDVTTFPMPSSATLSGNFDTLWSWNASSGARPTGFTAAWDGFLDSIVIERINYLPVYRTTLQPFTIGLRNLTGAARSYRLVRASGIPGPITVTVQGNSSLSITPVYANDQVSLYRADAASILDLTYVVSTTGKSFDFNGTNWIPQ
jgi:type II secretory pathway pseudopilin PulG